MDYKEAYEILHPDTTRQKLAEIEYYGGFAGRQKKIEAVNEACVVACEAMQELQDIKSQMDNNLKIYISELRQAKYDIETFWEEPTALSKALQIAIRALVEIRQYKQLGALDEVRAAVEKQKIKKPEEQSCSEKTHYKCPDCGFIMLTEYEDGYRLGNQPAFCERCGKHIDWSVSEC